MCPDKQILSALHDGEIPEPWQSRIYQHLEGCEDCRNQVKAYQSLSYSLDGDTPDFRESQERVWTRIALAQDHSAPSVPLWRRRVSVPAPLLAAAAVVVFLGVGFFVGISRNASPQAVSPEVWTVEFENHELEELAELLKSRDDQVQVFIELPDASLIGTNGEPQLIRAADYRRR